MACTVIYIVGNKSRPLIKGTQPRKAVNWSVKVWFVLPNGEKHTHSFDAKNVTLADTVPVVMREIENLIADHGNVVTSAGWTAHTQGR